MKKRITLVGLIIISFSKVSLGMLAVSKTYLLVDDKNRNTNITIFNNSNKEHNYKVTLVHYKQSMYGDYTKINKEENNIKFADKYLLYTPIQFTIKKGSSQIIRIQKKPMAGVKDGEYLSYLLITEIPNNSDFKDMAVTKKIAQREGEIELKLVPIFSMSIPLVVRKGELVGKASIKEVIFKKINDKVRLNISIGREGTKSLRGNLLIKVKNKIIKEINGINVFLSTTHRHIYVDFDKKTMSMFKKGNVIDIEYIDPDTKKVLATKNIII